MDTKSRYEVIAELEHKKRELILQRDNLDEELKRYEKELKNTERQKSDNCVVMDRKIDDIKEVIENFKAKMADKKETFKELIASVDDSLKRFNDLQKNSKS